MFGDEQRGEAFTDGDSLIDGTGRPFADHRHAADNAIELGDQLVDAGHDVGVAAGGEQFAAGLFVAGAQQGEIGFHDGMVGGLGVAHGGEQKVGDPGHGRHDDGDGTLAALGGGEEGGRAHTLGGADAGASEFHDEEIFQRKSFPLVMCERTIFKMASSTSSRVRGVESR